MTQQELSKIKLKKGTVIPPNVKCDCGHYKKDHYQGGWCHSSGHPKAGECGCTWYHPNFKYILRIWKEQKKK